MMEIPHHPLLNQVWTAVVSAKSELFLFFFAFALHRLLLGGRITLRNKGKAGKPASGKSDLDARTVSKDPAQVLLASQEAFSRGDHRSVLRAWEAGALRQSGLVPAEHLAQIVESMQRFQKSSDMILSELSAYLKRNTATRNTSFINKLLEPLAKSLDADLAQGIQSLLPTLGIQADSRTYEILMHMSFTTRSFQDVNALSQKMQAQGLLPTRRSNIILLKMYLQASKLDEALCKFREVASAASGTPTASEAPVHIASQIAELACRLGQPEAVLADLKDGTMPFTTEILNCLLVGCARAKLPEVATRVEAVAAAKGVERDGRTYHALLRHSVSDSAGISALLDEMVSKSISCPPEAANVVLTAAAHNNDVSLADKLYGLVRKEKQSPALQALVRFYADNGYEAKACELFDTHLKVASSNASLVDPRTERSLVSAALQCGRKDLAQALIEKAPADTAKHISIIRSFSSKGNLKDAMSAFRSLQAGGADVTQSLWNTALDACVECGNMELAQQLMGEIQAAGVADAVTYNTLIKAYLRAEQFGRARNLMGTMAKSGCTPNHVTYNELINALVRSSRNLQPAWEVVEEMQNNGVQPNRITCSILLKSLQAKTPQSDISRVMQLTSSMTEAMDEVLMSSIVEACVRVGKPQLLSNKLAELHGPGCVTITGAQTFGSLIKAYGFAKDIGGAWRCWKEMRSRHVKPTAVTIGCMVEAVATSGDVDGAHELISQLLDDEQCKDQINAIIFGSVIKGYGRMRRMERVWSVYQDMLAKGIPPLVTTLNAIIDCCARCSQMGSVAGLLEDMRKWHLEPNLITYSTIIKGYCQQGDLQSAFSALAKLRSTPGLKPDGIVYNMLLEACSQEGLVAEGERLFAEMQDADVAPTNYTLSVMVRLMNKARRVDRAFQIVEQVTKRYRFRTNSHVSVALVQACLASRDVHRASQVFQQAASERQMLDGRTRQSLIRALLSAGLPEQAAEVLHSTLRNLRSGSGANSSDQPQGCNWSTGDDSMVKEVASALSEKGWAGSDKAKKLLDDASDRKVSFRHQ